MNEFSFATVRSYEQAATLLKDKRFSLPMLKGGGMDIVDHLKEGLAEPDLLINVRRVREGGVDPIALSTSSGKPVVRIAASATMAEIARSPVLLEHAPVVANAVGKAATPQVRNAATAAGNLLQRPRCWYYRQSEFDCLKKGGSRCFAAEGENKYHAIFGDGPCHIVHPSNLAPALHVCDGVAHLTNSTRDSIAIADLFHMPDRGIRDEHNLKPGEIITHITLTPRPRSGFYVVKEKQSFDWPLVFACVAIESESGSTRISSARVCAGAVAPTPWPMPEVEAALVGVDAKDDAALTKALSSCTRGAKPMAQNAYKLDLLPVVLARATRLAAGLPALA